jgi:hypothetical protein
MAKAEIRHLECRTEKTIRRLRAAARRLQPPQGLIANSDVARVTASPRPMS